MKNAPLEANITQLHHQVSTLVRDLSAFNFEDEDIVVMKKRMELVEMDVDEETNYKPTMLTSGMVSTNELLCETAKITELSAERIRMGDSWIKGITGPRGPCGYATNTGATGPQGKPTHFTDLVDCPAEYRKGQWLMGTEHGLEFKPRRQLCHILSPSVLKDGIWCYNNETAAFAFQFYQEESIFCLEIHSINVLEVSASIDVELKFIKSNETQTINIVMLSGKNMIMSDLVKMDKGKDGLVQGFIKSHDNMKIAGVSVLFH